MKLVEVQATKELANAMLPDIFFKMAVNRVLDAAPAFDLVRCEECKNWDREHCSDGQGWCPKVVGYRRGDWYCAGGQKKDCDVTQAVSQDVTQNVTQ